MAVFFAGIVVIFGFMTHHMVTIQHHLKHENKTLTEQVHCLKTNTCVGKHSKVNGMAVENLSDEEETA